MKKILFICLFIGLIFQIKGSEEEKEMSENNKLNIGIQEENKIPVSNQKIFIFSKPDGGLVMGSCDSKEELEQHKGQMTQEEYINFILGDKCLSAIRFRFIKEEDYPSDNYFIDAWCDVTPESRIDIDCTKAKEIELGRLREKRQKSFEELGFPTRLHPELEKNMLSEGIRQQLQILRDITEPLKRLDTTNKYNDENLLEEIKKLGAL